ncbi:hypothetical protein BDD12DRAFT_909281 [Trichophaea hybrida]|nr:hypothetical protein BDD12DRAFT_909281 [Trichophaea hybrida]
MSKLTSLPTEVLRIIIEEIRFKKDQARLARVHSTFRILVTPILYRSYRLSFDGGITPTLSFECALLPGNNGVCYIRELEVDQFCDDRSVEMMKWGQRSLANLRLAKNAYSVVLLVLQWIPRDQLLAFHWRLPIPLSTKLNHELVNRQKSIAKYTYSYHPLSPFPAERRAPTMTHSSVTSLEIHQLHDMKSVENLSGILWKCTNLTNLSIGFNRDKMHNHLELLGAGSAARFSFWSHLRTRAPTEGEVLTLSLKSLSLSRMSVEKLEDLVELGALESLSLIECTSTELLLVLWNTSDRERNLKCLHIKPAIGEVQGIENQLNILLRKFSGLREFAFIHPSDVFYEYNISNLLECHRDSLRAVILDDTPITTDRLALLELYNKCPHLMGIGIQVSYNNFESLFRPLSTTSCLVANIRHFRVCNARRTTTAAQRLLDASTIAAGAIRSSKTPKLRLIIIQEGNKVECYYIQVLRNVLGQTVPMVTPMDIQTARNLEGELDVVNARATYVL